MLLRLISVPTRRQLAVPLRFRSLSRSLSSSSGSWTLATVQERINSHPWVSDCVVDDAEHIHGIPGTVAHVVPLWQRRGFAGITYNFSDEEPNASPDYQQQLGSFSNVDEEEVNAYLAQHGYEGPALRVVLLTDTQLTSVFFRGDERHSRLVLRDIIYAIFDTADADNDGEITMEEFQPLCDKYGIPSISFHDADGDPEGAPGFWSAGGLNESGDFNLSFAEFKGLFLKQDLIKVDGVDGRYVVQEALVDAVARPIFAKADADSNGSISLEEVTTVLEAYALHTEDDVASVFLAMDTDGDGTIDFEEFKAFLLSEGVLQLAKPDEGGLSSMFSSIFN